MPLMLMMTPKTVSANPASSAGRAATTLRRFVVARWLACAAAFALFAGCVTFVDEDALRASATPDAGGEEQPSTPDSGSDPAPDVSDPASDAEAVTEDAEEDSEDGVVMIGNQMVGPYTPPPPCGDETSFSFPYTFEGCGYTFDPPRWQLPNNRGQGGALDPHESCGTSTGASDPARYVHVSFPTEDAESGAAILWVTSADNRVSDVRIGVDPDNLDRTVRGFSFGYEQLFGQRIVHEVHICGLEPSTTYHYQVGGAGTWSPIYSFTTAPAYLSDDTFRFAATGDSRSTTQAMWGTALDRIEAHGADLIVFTGDAVDFGSNQEQWDVWWGQAEPTETTQRLAGLPLLYAHGNHDFVGDPMWALMAQPGNEQSYYVRYGNTLFVILDDSGTFLTQERIQFEIRDLLERALREHPDVTWRVVANHKPFYSASTRHGSTRQLQDAWMPLLEEYGVDLVLNGHDHNYERSCAVRGNQCQSSGNGTVYVVAAGIGAPLYGNGSDWWTVTSRREPSYVIVDVSPTTMSVVAYNLTGDEIDRFQITKR